MLKGSRACRTLQHNIIIMKLYLNVLFTRFFSASNFLALPANVVNRYAYDNCACSTSLSYLHIDSGYAWIVIRCMVDTNLLTHCEQVKRGSMGGTSHKKVSFRMSSMPCIPWRMRWSISIGADADDVRVWACVTPWNQSPVSSCCITSAKYRS